MSRTIIGLISVLILLGLAALFVWYFSVRLNPSIPERATIESLEGETRIEWHDFGVEVHFKDSDLDAYRAIGFAHAIDSPWLLALLRQAAIGELGAWFDADLSSLDSLVHLLDIPGTAAASRSELSQRATAVLQAYADGVNAGFQEGHVYRDESFLAINVTPDDWSPWHTVAIEKLIAWIAASESLRGHPEASDIFAETSKLSDFLEIGGFNNSLIWSVIHTDSTVTGVRYNTGSSQLRLLLPSRLVANNDVSVDMLTLLGTPFSFLTKTKTEAEIILPISMASIDDALVESADIDTTFGRIRRFDGREALVVRQRIGESLALACDRVASIGLSTETDSTPNDTMLSCTTLSWPGLGVTNDANKWSNPGQVGSLTLWSGGRALISPTATSIKAAHSWLASGFGNRITVATSSEWQPYLEARLVELVASLNWSPRILNADSKSAWAEQMVIPLQESLVANDTSVVDVASALTYLRNWDFQYEPASIAASILETWSAAVIDGGHILSVDSVSTDPVVAARNALDTLRFRFGQDMSEWRWETVNRQSLAYPAWSYLEKRSKTVAERYNLIISRKRDIATSASGHPSTLHWNSSAVAGQYSFPRSIVATIGSNTFSSITYESTATSEITGRLRGNTTSPEIGMGTFDSSDPVTISVLLPPR